jgi:hypothetical protein
MSALGLSTETLAGRLATRGAAGEVLSLITGQEPLNELRRLILQFSQACPAKQAHLQCPFHIMGTLSNASLTTLVNSLPRETCVDLFKMEQDCRSQFAAPCSSQSQSGAKESLGTNPHGSN